MQVSTSSGMRGRRKWIGQYRLQRDTRHRELGVIVMFIVLIVMIVVYIYTYVSNIYNIYAFIYIKMYQIVLSIYGVTVHQLYLGELLESQIDYCF